MLCRGFRVVKIGAGYSQKGFDPAVVTKPRRSYMKKVAEKLNFNVNIALGLSHLHNIKTVNI